MKTRRLVGLIVPLFLALFGRIEAAEAAGPFPFTLGTPVPAEMERFEIGDQSYYTFTLSTENGIRPSILYGTSAGFMADRIVYNSFSRQITAVGNVRVTLGPQVMYGDHLEYDTEMGRGMLTNADLRSDEISVSGGKIDIREIVVQDDDDLQERWNFEVVDGSVTTSGFTIPLYHVDAEFLRLVPKIRAWLYSASYHVTNIPYLYVPFPYLTRSLRKEPFAYVFEPGYSDEKGFILLNRFHFHYQDEIHPLARGTAYVDGYTHQGVGVGGKWNYLREPEADSYLYGYYIDQQNDFDEKPDARVNTEGSRGKIAFQHFQRFGKDKEWTVTAKGRRLSDPDFDEDYDDEERTRGFTENDLETDRDAFVNVARRGRNSNMRAIYKERLEDFNINEYPEDERQEVVYDSKLRPFQGTEIYHRYDFSAGHYKSHQTTSIDNIDRIQPPSVSENLDADIEQEFDRADFSYELNRPFPLDTFTLVPFAGYEGTAYSDAYRKTRVWTHSGENEREALVEEYDSRFRHVGKAGIEFNTKRIFNLNDPGAEINRRLLVKPTITLLGILPNEDFENVHPDDSKWRRYAAGTRQIQFSEELPHADRPGFPDIDQIDSIRDEFGGFELRLESRYQTRKAGGPVRDVIRGTLSTAVDFTETHSWEQEWSTVIGELYVSPYDWISYNSYVEYEPDGSYLQSFRNALTWSPADPLSFEVAYSRFQFTQDSPEQEELALLVDLDLSIRYSINYEERYDLDDNLTRLRKIGLTRDFHDWILNVGVTQRQRESREKSFGTYFTMTFVFPRSVSDQLPVDSVSGDDEEGIYPPGI
ncbi:MAG: hypothetical protein H6751_18305 [Candidatus Omnitrophica bacterium]|nr:hypothetical protein [Candidatus Omnitrophota bacterium]